VYLCFTAPARDEVMRDCKTDDHLQLLPPDPILYRCDCHLPAPSLPSSTIISVQAFFARLTADWPTDQADPCSQTWIAMESSLGLRHRRIIRGLHPPIAGQTELRPDNWLSNSWHLLKQRRRWPTRKDLVETGITARL
jgi:hypothetical protein